MGTTYQAQVEVHFPPHEYNTKESWQPVSRWSLQKDYTFSIAWSEVAVKGWPDNFVFLLGESTGDDDYDFTHMYNGDGLWLVELKPKLDSPWSLLLCEHVEALTRIGMRTRVLTWGE